MSGLVAVAMVQGVTGAASRLSRIVFVIWLERASRTA